MNRKHFTLVVLLASAALGCQPNANKSSSDSDAKTSLSDNKTITEKPSETASNSPPPAPPNNERDAGANQANSAAPNRNQPKSLPVTKENTAQAKALLEACFAKYKTLKSYEDRGIVRFRIPGSPEVNANFRVAWETPNRLAIHVNDVRGCWSSVTWEASVGGLYQNQRLVRPLPDKIDADWLFADNLGGVLNVSGVPIQIDLLLSKSSDQSLGAQGSELQLLEPETFDSQLCDRIALNGRITFWLDRQSQLLRKLDLPPELFRPNLSSAQLLDAEYSIEFPSIQTNHSIDWTAWTVPTTERDIAVRRLILPPPITSSAILGHQLKPFDLFDASGNLLLDSAQPKRPITVLCWIGPDAVAENLVKDLMLTKKTLLDRGLGIKAEIVLVSRDTSKSIVDKLKKWNCDLPLAIDTKDLTNSLFQIANEPYFVILDRDRRVQVSELIAGPLAVAAIPDVVQEIASDVLVAERQLQKDTDNVGRFIAALHRVAVDKTATEKIDAIRPFQFTMHGMTLDWKVKLDDGLVGAGAESYTLTGKPNDKNSLPFLSNDPKRVMTVLDETGKLLTFQSNGDKRVIASVLSEQADGAKRFHISPDPWTHEWISIVPEGLPRFWLVRESAEATSAPTISNPASLPPATAFNTKNEETPVAFAWTSRAGTPSLSIATTGSRLLVLDPNTEELKDAVTDATVAFIPGLTSSGNVQEWFGLAESGKLTPIRNLPTSNQAGQVTDQPIEARLDQLTIRPDVGAWIWGKLGDSVALFGLAKLNSGETGVVGMNHLYQAAWSRPLNARPDQSRLLSTATLDDGSMYCLAAAPNRVLHLFTANAQINDQASFGTRILGAGIFPTDKGLKLVVALEKEVSCWTINLPTQPRAESVPPKQESKN